MAFSGAGRSKNTASATPSRPKPVCSGKGRPRQGQTKKRCKLYVGNTLPSKAKGAGERKENYKKRVTSSPLSPRTVSGGVRMRRRDDVVQPVAPKLLPGRWRTGHGVSRVGRRRATQSKCPSKTDDRQRTSPSPRGPGESQRCRRGRRDSPPAPARGSASRCRCLERCKKKGAGAVKEKGGVRPCGARRRCRRSAALSARGQRRTRLNDDRSRPELEHGQHHGNVGRVQNLRAVRQRLGPQLGRRVQHLDKAGGAPPVVAVVDLAVAARWG